MICGSVYFIWARLSIIQNGIDDLGGINVLNGLSITIFVISYSVIILIDHIVKKVIII